MTCILAELGLAVVLALTLSAERRVLHLKIWSGYQHFAILCSIIQCYQPVSPPLSNWNTQMDSSDNLLTERRSPIGVLPLRTSLPASLRSCFSRSIFSRAQSSVGHCQLLNELGEELGVEGNITHHDW